LVTLNLPAKPAGFIGLDISFLGLILDPEGRVPETKPGNNSNQGQGLDKAVIAPAANTAVTRRRRASATVHRRGSERSQPSGGRYMDTRRFIDGYAGVSVAVSSNAGATWQSVPLCAAGRLRRRRGLSVVHFDDANL